MKANSPTRLHIGLVVPGFSAAEDDWCIPALLDLVRCLAQQHRVSVYTLRYPHNPRRYEIFGAHVRSFGGASAAGWRRIPLLLRAIRTIRVDARRQPFSVLHALWADEAGFVATLAGRLCKTPALVSLMGGELVGLPEIGYGVQLSRSGRLLTARSLRLASAVSAGSQQLLEQARQHTRTAHAHLLPLGVDLSRFRPAPGGVSPATLRVMHAASLTAVKDQMTLLEAFSIARRRLAAQEVSLQIAGDGPLRAALAAHARKLRIDRHVHFHGAIGHDQMPDFYRMGQLFVLSSLHESQSVALLEAAACGLPAVGTRVGLLAQLLPEQYLAAPADAQALAHAMVSLLGQEEARRREAHRLSSLVRQHYGLEETIEDLIAVYHQLNGLRT